MTKYSFDKKERQFVKELKKGNILSFNALFEEYSNRLYFFALRYLKNESEAEELVQEVFTRIWELRSKLKEELSFKSYIFTISFNIIKKHFQRKSQISGFYSDQVYSDFDIQTTKHVDYNSLLEHLRKVTDELPEKRKRIFQMSRFDGLNTTEIAEELSLSKKTVENQLHIALKYVRSKIERSELGTLLFLALFLSH